MYLRKTPVLCVLFLMGCVTPIQPGGTKITLLSLQPPPPLTSFLSDDASQFNEDVEQWRNTLLGYQTYLTGYIGYLTTTYRLKSPPIPKTCVSLPPPLPLTLSPLPEPAEDATDVEVGEALLAHIQYIRKQVRDYNMSLAEYTKKQKSLCE